MGIKFGLFSDLHYSLPHAEVRGNSKRTFEDVQKGMQRFADAGAEFAVSLGDNTQPAGDAAEQFDQLKTMVRKWNSYGVPVHASFGNHEFSQLSIENVLEIFQTDKTYYSFDIGDCRFLILDSCYNPDDSHFSEENFDWRFGKLSEDEVNWLTEKLADKKRTFIFTHYNLYYDPEEQYSEWYQVTNKERIWDILESYGCVEAVFQGHHHTYHHFLFRGIHFVNIPSPERSPEYNPLDFPIIELLENGFLYNGNPIE